MRLRKYGGRQCREVVYTHGLLNNQGPAVLYTELRLADQSVSEIEAWIGNFGSSNVWIFEGRLTLAEAQGRLTFPSTTGGRVDGYCVTGTGPSKWVMNEDTRALTIFFEAQNISGQVQGVGILVREFTAERD